MKGSECRLIEYMEGSKKRFIIPVYQRNYDWRIENCKQLYDDLVKIIKNNRRSHFFGCWFVNHVLQSERQNYGAHH